MYLDKEKAVKAFMGTGEKNAAGEDVYKRQIHNSVLLLKELVSRIA